MRLRASLAGMSLLAAMVAQPATADPITAAQARAVADQVISMIGANYVFPEKRAAITAALKAKEAAGRYDVTDTADLVARLGPDLTEAGHDRHLWIKYDPAQNAGLRQPHGDETGNDYFAQQGRLHNEGYESLRVLPGNIRYLNMVGFHWNSGATLRAAADAAQFLSGGDAVIIDLRENGGGSGAAVQALISYFLPPDHRVLMTFHQGANGAATSTRVLSRLGGPRMVGKPLYVLISDHTGSAAEEFAYHIKQFKLGTLVGHASAGAANNNTLFPIGTGFVVSISMGRPVHPVSGTNWEGVGVPPDVAVPADAALDTAQVLALKMLAARPGADAATYAWGIDGLNGKLRPLSLDAVALAAYAGTYGERVIRLENGALVYQRGGTAPTTLSPLSPDLFAFGNSEHVRARFKRTGGTITGFDMVTDDGQTISVPRTG